MRLRESAASEREAAAASQLLSRAADSALFDRRAADPAAC